MTPQLAFSLACLLSSADTSSTNSLRQLSSSNFRTRTQASRQLASQMPRVHLLVRWTQSTSSDPEAVNRAQRILSDFDGIVWNLRPHHSRYWPHFDMIDAKVRYGIVKYPEPLLPHMMGFRDRFALVQYYVRERPMLEDAGPDWQDWRSGTYWYTSDLLYSGLAKIEDVPDFLEALMPVQRAWYRQVGSDHPE